MIEGPGRLIAFVAAVAFTAGCGSSPTTPSPAAVAGHYAGPVQDTIAGAGTITLALAQNGTALTGNWRTTFPSEVSAGTLSGSITGPTATLTLTPDNSTLCPLRMTVTDVGSLLDGTYTTLDCPAAHSGTFSAERTTARDSSNGG